jgi:hypothetical protein
LFKQCFSDEKDENTPTLLHFGEFVRVLGEVEKFFDRPYIYLEGKIILVENFLQSKPFAAKNPKTWYCFYKEFAIFFDEQGRVAYHFNRSQKQMFVLGRGSVVNRYKNALKREQDAIGKNHTFENNAAWRMYWEFAQKVMIEQAVIL